MRKDVLIPKLEELEDKHPASRQQLQAVRSFVNRVYDSLPGKAVEGFSEVLRLIREGSGPVSHDPVDLA